MKRNFPSPDAIYTIKLEIVLGSLMSGTIISYAVNAVGNFIDGEDAFQPNDFRVEG